MEQMREDVEVVLQTCSSVTSQRLVTQNPKDVMESLIVLIFQMKSTVVFVVETKLFVILKDP